MGDFNAKVGADNSDWVPTLGNFGLGKANNRGEKLLEFCALHVKLAVCNTYFQHKTCKRVTWTSPDGQYKNQIDFIITQLDNLRTFQNCRSYCSADIGSDHNLVIANVKLFPIKAKRLKTLPRNYDVSRFCNPVIAEEFCAKIGGAFEPLLQLPDTDVDSLWTKFKDTTNKITEDVVGHKKAKQVKGLPEDVRKACEEKRNTRLLMLSNSTTSNKAKYRKLNKTVKYEVKRWKKKLLDKDVEDMEGAYAKNNSHELFKRVKKLTGERDKTQLAAKNKEGILKTATEEVMKCWEEHFYTHLNTQFPRDENVLQSIPDPPNTDAGSEPFTLAEVEVAVKSLKNNKACSWDKIAAETLKAGGAPMRQLLLKIIIVAWTEGKTPEDWSKGLIIPVFKKGDKLNPSNYRAITILSIPGKVFCRMILISEFRTPLTTT